MIDWKAVSAVGIFWLGIGMTVLGFTFVPVFTVILWAVIVVGGLSWLIYQMAKE